MVDRKFLNNGNYKDTDPRSSKIPKHEKYEKNCLTALHIKLFKITNKGKINQRKKIHYVQGNKDKNDSR